MSKRPGICFSNLYLESILLVHLTPMLPRSMVFECWQIAILRGQVVKASAVEPGGECSIPGGGRVFFLTRPVGETPAS